MEGWYFFIKSRFREKPIIFRQEQGFSAIICEQFSQRKLLMLALALVRRIWMEFSLFSMIFATRGTGTWFRK